MSITLISFGVDKTAREITPHHMELFLLTEATLKGNVHSFMDVLADPCLHCLAVLTHINR